MEQFWRLQPLTSELQTARLRRLRAEYPFVYSKTLTKTAHGRAVEALQIGQGDTKLLLTAGHHANEYITSMMLWELIERYCRALCCGGTFGGVPAGELYHNAMIYAVPMVNPDGIDLVTGAIAPDSAEYRAAWEIAARYPDIPFPSGWKANLDGTDLNLNYPAGWDDARRIKAELGVSAPAPRDYPGPRPLSEPETMALAGYTCCVHPDLVLAWHTQGRVIYHRFGALRLPRGEQLAAAFSAVSGYALEDVPPESANGGYKDWFIQRFRRPGFTIEAGLGENPLPLSQLEQLCGENERLLALAMQE